MVRKFGFAVAAILAAMLVVVAARTIVGGPPAVRGLPSPAVSIDEAGAARRLADSVRFQTISFGPEHAVQADAFHGLHELLRVSFPRVHATLVRETVNQYSLLYTWPGIDPTLPAVLLLAHMDVVPVEPGGEGSWHHPPFAGVIADGFIWGRGTLDMKVSVLGLLEAVEHLLARGAAPRRTVYLAFGHDEEIGGNNGAAQIAALLAARGVRLDFTLDEGSVIAHGIIPGLAKPAALIGIAEKGYLTLELSARVDGGHSSMPQRRSAIGKIGHAVARLEAQPMPAALRDAASQMFEYLAPDMPLVQRAVLHNQWLFGPLLIDRLTQAPATNALVRTTGAATIIAGGIKENVLPGEARAVINFRILPGDTIEGVVAHVRRAIGDPDVRVRVLGPAHEASPLAKIGVASFATLAGTIANVFPDAAIAPTLVLPGTDSKHYLGLADNSYRFLPLRLRAEDLARIHGANERIAIGDYRDIIRFYIELIGNAAL